MSCGPTDPAGRRKIVVPVGPTRPNCLMMFAAGAITTAALHVEARPRVACAVGRRRVPDRGGERAPAGAAQPWQPPLVDEHGRARLQHGLLRGDRARRQRELRDPGVGPQQHRREPRDVARQGRRGDRLERVGRRQVRVARDRPHPLVRGRPVGREEGGEPVAITRRAALDGSVDAFRRAADRRGVRYARRQGGDAGQGGRPGPEVRGERSRAGRARAFQREVGGSRRCGCAAEEDHGGGDGRGGRSPAREPGPPSPPGGRRGHDIRDPLRRGRHVDRRGCGGGAFVDRRRSCRTPPGAPGPVERGLGVRRQLARAPVPRVGVLGQALVDDLVERGGEIGPHRAQRRRRGVDVLEEQGRELCSPNGGRPASISYKVQPRA